MFIYNVKLNGTKTFKIIFCGIVILVIVILCICTFRVFNGAKENFVVEDEIGNSDASEILPQNYANVLKAVHENIDTYIGMNIKFTGYVYRLNDLADNQFVLARNMLTAPDSQEYVVVGFLCETPDAKSFSTNSWVEITGTIQKGSYHGSDMPVVNIQNITSTRFT